MVKLPTAEQLREISVYDNPDLSGADVECEPAPLRSRVLITSARRV
jgi:hypothetical protein